MSKKRKTAHQFIEDELRILEQETERKINNLDIYSLVGNPKTGKTTILNELISELSEPTNQWQKVEINDMGYFKKSNPNCKMKLATLRE